MIDINVINGAIAELEAKEMTFQNLNKLSVLYVVRDANILHQDSEAKKESKKVAQTIPDVSDSEFMDLALRCNPVVLWKVLDELLLTIQALYPKLYDETLKMIADGV